VNFVYDPAKDRANVLKHGISLGRASDFDFAAARFIPDNSQDYGEPREVAVSFLAGNLYVLVFVQLDDQTVRVISLRRASGPEEKDYAEY
jgi:uncharacterized DUF497 family protein